jgi:uncharacterized protein (DUF2336 family)
MAEARSSQDRKPSDAARLLLAAARERFAVAASDLLLPDQARLTEWQRLTAAALLARLVGAVEDDLRGRLAVSFETNAALHAALSSAHVPIALPILDRARALHDAELTAILVRRAEEHRFWTAHAGRGQADLLHDLIRDAEDDDIAAEAMELVIARARRFDRFQEPLLGRVELPAELQHRLVWRVAAALRHYIVQHHQAAGVDAAVETAASALIAGYDEGETMEAGAMRLARRLDRAGRLDGALLARALEEGMLPVLIAGLAVRCALDGGAVWEVLFDPRGRGPALLLRAGGIDRPATAAILLALASRGPLLSGVEEEAAASQLELYDTLDEAAARDVLRLWQANPAYRASVARISTRVRAAAEAA